MKVNKKSEKLDAFPCFCSSWAVYVGLLLELKMFFIFYDGNIEVIKTRSMYCRNLSWPSLWLIDKAQVVSKGTSGNY